MSNNIKRVTEEEWLELFREGEIRNGKIALLEEEMRAGVKEIIKVTILNENSLEDFASDDDRHRKEIDDALGPDWIERIRDENAKRFEMIEECSCMIRCPICDEETLMCFENGTRRCNQCDYEE